MAGISKINSQKYKSDINNLEKFRGFKDYFLKYTSGTKTKPDQNHKSHSRNTDHLLGWITRNMRVYLPQNYHDKAANVRFNVSHECAVYVCHVCAASQL